MFLLKFSGDDNIKKKYTTNLNKNEYTLTTNDQHNQDKENP